MDKNKKGLFKDSATIAQPNWKKKKKAFKRIFHCYIVFHLDPKSLVKVYLWKIPANANTYRVNYLLQWLISKASPILLT